MTGEERLNVIECPCQTFCSIRDVQEALYHEDRTRTLIHWLSGEVDEAAFREKRSLSCGVAAAAAAAVRCKNRVRSSLSILNAIRDACRPFLESHGNSAGGGVSGGKPDKDAPDETPVVYEDAFPSLASLGSVTTTHITAITTTAPKKANVLVGRKKVKPPKSNAVVSVEKVKPPVKPKRRIRPASVNAVSSSAWGQSTTSSTFPSGNLVNLPSEEPLILDSRTRGPPLVSQASSESEAKRTAAATVTKDEHATDKAAVNTSFSTPSKKPAPTTRILETKDEIATLPRLQNLIDTYCTLIRSSLVPSTALELHLLIRLLTLTTQDTETCSGESELSEILCSTSRCLYFSCQALRQLAYILRGIGMPLLPELVRCRPFYSQLPELAQEFELLMEEQAARGLSKSALPVGNQTALLTLPFNQQRDSRHNYKSREDQALYKNREESRDAFLYQLRAFLSVRGKLVDAAQADKAIRKIKMSSRVVVDDVTDVNMSWFAGFFCDLLLQIGFVPLQETDKDLLNIADKDKLQKLHKRFSSKVSQTNKSSKKVVADPKRDTKAASPVEDAQQYFTGHQEVRLKPVYSITDSICLRLRLRFDASPTK
jgi:hypothetical protein